MKPHTRYSQSGTGDWISAIITLCVLFGIFSSMDRFAGFASLAPTATGSDIPVSSYWSQENGYGFSSEKGDNYTTTNSGVTETVQVKNKISPQKRDNVKVSYYRDTPIEVIDHSLPENTPRVYARLSHGIAVIEGDLDSARVKTIFSTLHTD